MVELANSKMESVMYQFKLAHVALLLLLCSVPALSQPPAPPPAGGPSIPDDDPISTVLPLRSTYQLNQELGRIEDEFTARQQRLISDHSSYREEAKHQYAGSTYASGTGSSGSSLLNDTYGLLHRTVLSVRQTLLANNLRALDAYVGEEFGEIAAGLSGNYSYLDPLGGTNEDRIAKTLFARAKAIISRVRSLPYLQIDLQVTTAPTGAVARFFLRNHTEHEREIHTDDTAGGLDVGRYIVKVQKDGHKVAEVEINLIDNPIDSLSCTLRRPNDPEQSTCTQRKKPAT